MLLNNKESQKLTLKLVQTPKNELIKKENGAVTLISEENTLYMYMNCECKSKVACTCKCKRKLKNAITAFVLSNKYDVNINIASFMEFYQPEHEVAFRVIVEAILFSTHNVVSRKESRSKNEVKYNLVYSGV